MAISIAHKLRALKEGFYPTLRFRLYAPALTVEQVREHDLPSTPLKETERRASRWQEAYGIEQTEIDALASLDPETLEEIARQAIEPYFDDTLEDRVSEAEAEWQRKAQRKVNAAAKAERGYAKLRENAITSLTKAKESLEALDAASKQLVSPRDLPDFDLPEAEPKEDGPKPLVSSDMFLLEHIRRLRARKSYDSED